MSEPAIPQAGWRLQTASDRPRLRRFQVLGERCSGTNFLDALMRRNTPLEPTFDYGWKHAFPGFTNMLDHDLLLIVVRSPLDWMRSIYLKPWHVPDARLDVTFAEFLRQPWETVVDMPGSMNAVGRFQALGKPLQTDRHPITGLPPENLPALRNLKLAAQIGCLNRGGNIALLRHEAVAQDPGAALGALAGAFGFAIRHPQPRVPARALGSMRREIALPRREARPAFNGDDRAFVAASLDRAQEASLGYDLDALLAAEAAQA